MQEYPPIHKNFYNAIENCDCFLLCNFDKKGIEGYIGSAGFAELAYAVAQNAKTHSKQIFIYKMPSKEVQCYDEIKLYLSLGWIKLWK